MKTPFQIDAEGIVAVDRGETVAWDVALQRIDAAIERGATMRRKMQIAIAASGDIHIWLGHKMPTAANLVEIELERDGDMYVVPADKAGPLRELLGTGEVAAQVGVRGHSRLQRVLAMAETLVDEIRAEIDGDIDPLVDSPRA